MSRLHKGQLVVRTSGILEGPIKEGDKCIVKCIVDSQYMELEEYEGLYLRSNFKPVEDYIVPKGRPDQMSSIEALETALKVLDHWNRTHTTSMMISVEAYPAQDGGSLFTTPTFDSNNIGTMIEHLLDYSSKEEKAAALERAAAALRFGA